MVRIQAAGDVVEAQRRLRAAVGADEYVAWVDVINEAIDRIAHTDDGEALAKHIDDLNFRLLKETKRADDAVAENERLRTKLEEAQWSLKP